MNTPSTEQNTIVSRPIPGERGIPGIGHTVAFLRNANAFFTQRQQQYGDVFRFSVFGKSMVGVCGPNSTKHFLVNHNDQLSSQQAWENSLSELFPNGLMLMDGDRHQHHRSILRTAFTKSCLEGYIPMMTPLIDEYLSGWQGKRTMNTFHEIKALTLQLALKVFFGLEADEKLHEINRDIIRVVKAATAVPLPLPYTTYRRGVVARKRLEAYFAALVKERRANPGSDLISILTNAQNEEGHQLTDQEIVDHAIFILMAAHDTTASTITSLLYRTAQHPDWQEKIRTEYAALATTTPNIKELVRLPHLSLVLKETLRLHPPLILLPRVLLQDIEYQEYHLPAGTRAMFLVQCNHLDETVWDNADAFDPLRFDKPREEHLSCPHHYAPFGASKHYCLGFSFAELQISMIVGKISEQYRWSLPPDYQMHYQNIPIQEPKDGLPLKIDRV